MNLQPPGIIGPFHPPLKKTTSDAEKALFIVDTINKACILLIMNSASHTHTGAENMIATVQYFGIYTFISAIDEFGEVYPELELLEVTGSNLDAAHNRLAQLRRRHPSMNLVVHGAGRR